MDTIIDDFCKAWQTLDASLIIKHLDKAFVYDSQWVFESQDYNGYISYISGKFETLKRNGSIIEASVVDDPHFGSKMLKLIQNRSAVCYYRIKVQDGKVVKGDLCMF